MTTAAIIAALIHGGPLVLEFWLKIQSILNLGDDEKANILKEITLSDQADEDTKSRVAAWLASH